MRAHIPVLMAYINLPTWPTPPPLRSAAGQQEASASLEGARESTPGRGSINSRNARRLQLRRAGFRGAFLQNDANLSARKVSPRQSIAISETRTPNDQDRHRFDILRSRQEADDSGGRRSTSPSVLQELSNHATRTRTPSRPYLSNVLNNLSDRSPLQTETMGINNENVGFDDSPQTKSPLNVPKMRRSSRDGSGPRLSLSSTRVTKIQRKLRTANRSPSYETNKYIEHLEAELASVNAKFDALTSLSTVKGQSSKIRTLNRQVQALQRDIEDWEKQFDERVEEQVYERTQIEASLKSKARELEDELDAKDTRVMDLQRELDSTREQLMVSETLEVDLNRRIDILTELLSQSPTRTGFSMASPAIGFEKRKQRNRPHSMILPIPELSTQGSATGENDSLNHLSLKDPADRESMGLSAQTQQMQEADSDPTKRSDTTNLSLLSDRDDANCEFDHSLYDHSRLVPKDPWVRSAPTSRPTSFLSVSSYSSAVGLPIATSTPTKAEARSRRMRRFVGGGSTLKPLLLPSASATSDEATSPTDRHYWSPTRTKFSSPVATSTDTSYDYFDPEDHRLSLNAKAGFNETYETTDAEEVMRCSSQSSFPPDPIEGMLYEQYMAAAQNSRSGFVVPAAASSSLVYCDLKPPRDDEATPMKPTGDADEPPTQSSSNNLRTLRLRSPSSDLNSIVMQDTPCKSKLIFAGGQKIDKVAADAPEYEDNEKTVRSLTSSRSGSPSTDVCGIDRCINRVTRLVISLKRETLLNMKSIVVRSWKHGSHYFGAFGWWLFGLDRLLAPAYTTNQHGQEAKSELSVEHSWTRFLGLPVHLTPTPKGTVAAPERPSTPVHSAHLRSLVRSQARHPMSCSECIEPPLQRRLRLWWRFSLTVVLAIGIAILHGPETLMEEREVEDGKRAARPMSA